MVPHIQGNTHIYFDNTGIQIFEIGHHKMAKKTENLPVFK